ncbi:ADP-ribosylglycohydrolase family protein [Verrucomicrobiales bacterium]|nr:ADP-ribosylglycohydrolase family protein [Verrucomicrobiales bacterium]
MTPPTPRSEITDRVHSGLLGSWIGDALAMPVHWYYNRFALAEEYGTVVDFVAPKNPHSGSILWRSHWEAPSEALDILGDQRSFWGQRDVHYHQNLKAGENTLTVKLAAEVWKMMQEIGGYDADQYLKRYIDLMTSPERHRDTYVEECHRGFFTNLGRGIAPMKCGVSETHIGGLAMMLPVAFFYADDPFRARKHALEHLAFTHSGKEMRLAGEAVLSLLLPTLEGESLTDVIREEIRTQRNPLFGFPFLKWLEMPDEKVIGKLLSTACYVDQSVPAVIYLALKYANDPEQGLISNTNLGGDNVHRGAVLGALLGAANSEMSWPDRWVNNLAEPPVWVFSD